jgi:hypothetical protein
LVIIKGNEVRRYLHFLSNRTLGASGKLEREGGSFVVFVLAKVKRKVHIKRK